MENEKPRLDAPGSTDESYTPTDHEKQVKPEDKQDQDPYRYHDWASI